MINWMPPTRATSTKVFLQIFKQLLQSDADFSNIHTWTRCIAALALALALAIAIAIATLYMPVSKSSIQHTRTFVLLCFLNFRRLLFMTTSTDTNNNNSFEFKAEHYASYVRSASANRASTFATLYKTTVSYEMFKEHAEKLALAFSTTTGVDTATLGLVAMISKLPVDAYDGLEAKSRLNVQLKPSLDLNDEFAKNLVPFLTALAVVSKYCTVS